MSKCTFALLYNVEKPRGNPMKKKRILVVSSANMDFIMNIRTLPSAGQTLIDDGSYRFAPGGKGANAAVAIQRLGGDCVFCTRLGNDANGAILQNLYEKEGIDTRFIAHDKKKAGDSISIIWVNKIGGYEIKKMTLSELKEVILK